MRNINTDERPMLRAVVAPDPPPYVPVEPDPKEQAMLENQRAYMEAHPEEFE